MYLPVEIETKHQVYHPIQHPNYVLVYKYGACVQSRNDDPHGDEAQHAEHRID